ncbi:glycerophosphodiester phosphodiesterase family protein [Aeromicrobium sp. Leaf350]|uniref:glycerophosphodiester phosphodiesterase family protein n=1 Tax=Aeromicrobium sp. Leaf350 TaxID=2876565 RepID=UPI001E4B062A|nr:glycerophosphodiester phosphodiesterase family protein [Aeromicrobium sp. Leaf350]
MERPLVSPPLIIAHRGVPTYRLEHTRASYELAIEWGADFIEPDVVCTSDGHLVVRHENEISETTDVALHPEFAGRRTTKLVDAIARTGWFTEDFTLEELQTLRTVERLPQLRPRNIALAEPIVTLEEVLDIAEAADRRVGVYVETKHPGYFADLDLDLDDRVLAALERRGLNRADADVPVMIQSFETRNLRGLRPRTPLPLIQLIDRKGAPWDFMEAQDPRTYADLTTPEALAEIATYADGIGPNKSLVVGRRKGHWLTGETGLVAAAHAVGLQVHVWTMRDENNFLPADFKLGEDLSAHGDALAEYRVFLEAGVDGFFADDTSTAREALRRMAEDLAGESVS